MNMTSISSIDRRSGAFYRGTLYWLAQLLIGSVSLLCLLGTGYIVPTGILPVTIVTPTPPKPTPVPAATSTPTETQTPLRLSDPTATDTTISSQPWWQSGLDVLWKLALVLGLIYGSMRLLALVKEKGETGLGLWQALKPQPPRPAQPFHLLESLEEIRLSPHHTLHAVRVAHRVVLLARSGTTLTIIGDSQFDALAGSEPLAAEIAAPVALTSTITTDSALTETAPTSFRQQLLSAWSNIVPPPTHASAREPEAVTPDVFDAQWVTVEPDVTPLATPTATSLPVRKGIARPSDRPAPPEPLDDSTIREMIYYAEEHGVTATATKYGVTNQRITSIRARYEKARAKRLYQQAQGHNMQLATENDDADDLLDSPKPPPRPHPTGTSNDAVKQTLRVSPRRIDPKLPTPTTPPPASATASGITQPFAVPRPPNQGVAASGKRSRAAIITTYGQATPLTSQQAAPQPDVARDASLDKQASSIAQTLATRFNIRIDSPPRRR